MPFSSLFSVVKRKFVFIPVEFLFHEILHQAMRASRWLVGPLIFQIRNNLNFSGDSCCAEAREGVYCVCLTLNSGFTVHSFFEPFRIIKLDGRISLMNLYMMKALLTTKDTLPGQLSIKVTMSASKDLVTATRTWTAREIW